MKLLTCLICFLIPSASANAQSREDFLQAKKIALETDEPSFGLEISEIVPDSLAEEMGLKPGDFITQYGETILRKFHTPREEDERIFFVRKGQRAEDTVIPPGKLGFYYREIFRPWIDYLRGDIGVSDEAWDESVVSALQTMRRFPDEANVHWNRAKAAGYEDDELAEIISAYIAWKQGKTVDVQKVFDSVFAEFEKMPPIYFVILEDLAYAYGALNVITALKQADPASIAIPGDDLDRWAAFAQQENRSVQNEESPLKDLESRHGPEITEKLELIHPKAGIPVRIFLRRARLGAPPGRLQFSRMIHPEGLENFHVRMKVRLASMGQDNQFATAFRLELVSRIPSDKEEGKFISKPLTCLLAGNNEIDGDYLQVMGGGSLLRRSYSEVGVDIPVLPVTAKGDPAELHAARLKSSNYSEVLTFDLFSDETHSGVLFNGIPYARLPKPADSNDCYLLFHVTGLSLFLEEFHVWRLEN